MRKLTLALLLLSCPAWGDVIELKDGTRIEGDLKRSETGWIVSTPDGKVRAIAAAAVKSVQLGASTRPREGQPPVSDALASLRRVAEALPDITQIIERYQRFIETNRDERAVADARADLATWEERRTQGFVKYGNKWMSREDWGAMASRTGALIDQAREMMMQNRTREADQWILQALAADPANPAAHYLQGFSLYRQNRFAEARKAFEAVNNILPAHPPTLNNLGVIVWRQNQQAAALNYYEQALAAAGVNEYILNNTAEALGMTSEDLRKGAAYARCLRRFTELDQMLQKQMAPQGRFRWGSSWIDQKALDELKVSEKIVRDRLKGMQNEFDQAQVRIREIDLEINGNNKAMTDMTYNRQAFRDGNGNLVVMPLPDAYYQLERLNRQLAVEQEALKVKMFTLQQDLPKVQKQLPAPAFTGVQQIVGVEGMPSAPDLAAPTTRPSPSLSQ